MRVACRALSHSVSRSGELSPSRDHPRTCDRDDHDDRVGGRHDQRAISAAGLTYDLVVPALALPAGVEITMTPIAAVGGLPLSGGFVAGVDFQPAGLVFAQPATLTIATSRQPSASQHIVGFTYEGTGASFHIAPAKAGPTAITLVVSHFSGVGVGFGTTQDIEALLGQQDDVPDTSEGAVELLLTDSLEHPPDGVNELFLMELWFDEIILPELQAVTTDAQLVVAVGTYELWRHTIPELLDVYLFVPGGEDAPSLVSRRSQWEGAFSAKAAFAIAGNKQLCAAPGIASARLAALDNAIFWHRLAAIGYRLATPQNGLDLAALQANLCARSVTQSVSLPDPISPGSSNALDIQLALQFSDGVVVPTNFVVTASAQGAALQLPGFTALVPPGFSTGVVNANPDAGSVTIDLRACYGGGEFVVLGFAADEICHTEHLVRSVAGSLPTTLAGMVTFHSHKDFGGGIREDTLVSATVTVDVAVLADGRLEITVREATGTYRSADEAPSGCNRAPEVDTGTITTGTLKVSPDTGEATLGVVVSGTQTSTTCTSSFSSAFEGTFRLRGTAVVVNGSLVAIDFNRSETIDGRVVVQTGRLAP